MEVVKDCMTAQYNEYIDYLRDVKKSSGNTLEAYVRDLRKFVDFANFIVPFNFYCNFLNRKNYSNNRF